MGSNLNVLGKGFPAGFSAKFEDPLIRADADKIVKDQQVQIEQEYKQSIDEIDRNFDLRKKELIDNHQAAIEKEKTKWETFKKNEEKKIRLQAESHADSKLHSFKENLRLEEEQEIRRIQMETDNKIRDFERDLEQKFESEKRQLQQNYEKIKHSVEESEKDRFDFEIEKFRAEQGK